MAALLEERHRNRIKVALFVRRLIDESGDIVNCGKAEKVSLDGTECGSMCGDVESAVDDRVEFGDFICEERCKFICQRGCSRRRRKNI